MELAILPLSVLPREGLPVVIVQQGMCTAKILLLNANVKCFDIIYSFGVCCLFIYNSASTSVSENCSYIQNPNFPSAYGSTSTISWTVTKCAPSKLNSVTLKILHLLIVFTKKPK